MSQNLAVMPDSTAFLSDASKNLGLCVGYFNYLDEIEDTIYKEIPNATDEELVETYKSAARGEGACWRVRAACCFEAMRRRLRLKGGRGKIDLDQEGAVAYADEVAKEFGCDDGRRVREDAQLFSLFLAKDVPKTLAVSRQSLSEKTYYLEAMRSDDPQYALEAMADYKRAHPSFRTTQARAFVDKLNAEQIETEVVLPPELQQKAYEDRAAWLNARIEIVTTWKDDAPTPELAARCRRWLSELKWEKTRSPEKENRRVLSAIRLNLRNVADIADQAGISERETRTILNRLLAADLVQCRVKGGETDAARGTRQEYWALKGERLGSDAEVFPQRLPYYECDVDE